jgi:hypothetical protein
MEIQVVNDDDKKHLNGERPSQPFKIDPGVESIMQRGQERRRMESEIKERLTLLVEQLLEEYPDQDETISRMLEGESCRMRSNHEQKIRREREARRAKENGHVTNGSSKGSVSGSVQDVPGGEPGTGGGTTGSGGGDQGKR